VGGRFADDGVAYDYAMSGLPAPSARRQDFEAALSDRSIFFGGVGIGRVYFR
jgi:hypothetical protein